jgi:hypothetical protein
LHDFALGSRVLVLVLWCCVARDCVLFTSYLALRINWRFLLLSMSSFFGVISY